MAPENGAGIVLDTSFLVAYHNQRDVHHGRALDVMDRLRTGEWGLALLPEYVFLELVTVLARRRDLTTAVSAGDSLLASEELVFVPCSEIFLDAFDVFRGLDSSNPSFADAAIVAIARQRGIERIATFDRDFLGVAGLEVVPNPAS
ncbi:MAG: type II toxin-antitoxin system VapC family toxin [Vicinamibacteria bacterium]